MPRKEHSDSEHDGEKCYTIVIGASIRDTTDGDHSAFLDLGIVYKEMHEEQRQITENFLSEYSGDLEEALRPLAKLLTKLGNKFLEGNAKFEMGLGVLQKLVEENPPKGAKA